LLSVLPKKLLNLPDKKKLGISISAANINLLKLEFYI